MYWNWSYSPETPNLGQIRRYLEPCDLEIWQMTLKNNRAPFLCNFKLCASFRNHWCIETGVDSPETPNLGQIRRYLETCDLEIWRMTLNKANLRDLLAATWPKFSPGTLGVMIPVRLNTWMSLKWWFIVITVLTLRAGYLDSCSTIAVITVKCCYNTYSMILHISLQ